MTVDLEARPPRLHHIERRGRRTEAGKHLRIEVERRHRNRDVVALLGEVILDLKDLEVGQVDERVQPLHGVRVVVVERKSSHPGEAVEDAPPLLDLVAEVAHGPGIDTHQVKVVYETAAPQRLLKACVRLHGRLDLEHLRDRDHGAGL